MAGTEKYFNVSVRLKESEKEQLDYLLNRYNKNRPGQAMTQADMLRLCIDEVYHIEKLAEAEGKDLPQFRIAESFQQLQEQLMQPDQESSTPGKKQNK